MNPAINNDHKIRKKTIQKKKKFEMHEHCGCLWRKKNITGLEKPCDKLRNIPSILKTLKSKLENMK